jgi:hypothetical protein
MQPLGARGLIDEVVALARTVCPIYTERDDAMGTGEYARPDLLAEPDWVWEHRGEASVRVVDCGPGALAGGLTCLEPSCCQSIPG